MALCMLHFEALQYAKINLQTIIHSRGCGSVRRLCYNAGYSALDFGYLVYLVS